MKTATVRQVRHDFGTVLKLVEDGEEIAITKRGHVVARLCPPPCPPQTRKVSWPDFLAMQREIYGNPRQRMLTPAESKQLRDDLRGDR